MENHLDGDTFSKAKFTVDNCEKILSDKIVNKAIEEGLETDKIDLLCRIIKESVEEYKKEKERAMMLINDYEICKWIDGLKPQTA